MGDPTFDEAVNELVNRPEADGRTLGLVVMRAGKIIAEWYGVQPANVFQPELVIDADTRLISWSMAKSITHAALAVAVDDGLLDLDDPAPVPEWADSPRSDIQVIDLLEMRSGLRFVEDYVDGDTSHCLDMLFGDGANDHAGYATALPLDHPPRTVWSYSSGTTNILSRILAQAIGGGQQGVEKFLRERLFEPAGMYTAEPRFDAAGTFVGSSYVYASTRDFARFGELYRNDGEIDGRRVLLRGWTDHARTYVATDPENGFSYGRHWWMWPEYPGSLLALGYEGQYCAVIPDAELVVAHLGKTDNEIVRERVDPYIRRLIDAASAA